MPRPQVSLAYDVDMSDSGMLGAGAYGTVLAAVHRSTGRQVAIKTMLKKYLLSDAEKAGVEREIEIQKVRCSVYLSHHRIRFTGECKGRFRHRKTPTCLVSSGNFCACRAKS